ncbi:hypothetical protein IUY40_16290 [Flavobacterium sp. ALJ2]|uniref:hypothetical protein n=1 Tax=Flavobacterium sp. ALJ2 TaxID=2786960 RepID=UPI00189CCC5B|nr:hypothetical protein [Flavobacterium sp. ALJ2]MBF7093092.1 hypothetical protein [Flavobacterium sp. ALJ2]
MEKQYCIDVIPRIQDEICNKILNDIEINKNDLFIFQLDLYDNEEYLTSVKYLLTREFSKEHKLKNPYKIYNEEEESKYNFIYNYLGAVSLKIIENYKYIDNIRGSIKDFLSLPDSSDM